MGDILKVSGITQEEHEDDEERKDQNLARQIIKYDSVG